MSVPGDNLWPNFDIKVLHVDASVKHAFKITISGARLYLNYKYCMLYSVNIWIQLGITVQNCCFEHVYFQCSSISTIHNFSISCSKSSGKDKFRAYRILITVFLFRICKFLLVTRGRIPSLPKTRLNILCKLRSQVIYGKIKYNKNSSLGNTVQRYQLEHLLMAQQQLGFDNLAFSLSNCQNPPIHYPCIWVKANYRN